MNGFVVRLVVLSVMWAVCEMLLPEGKTRQAVRFVVSLLVMLSLMAFMGEALKAETFAPEDTMVFTAGQDSCAGRIYLRSRANQTRDYVAALCRRAGYEADVTVYLTMDGATERIELTLWTRDGQEPLMNGTELGQSIREALLLEERALRITEKAAPKADF